MNLANSRGIATLTTGQSRPVIVLDSSLHNNTFYQVQDAENGNHYTIHKSQFKMLSPIPSRFRQHVFDALASHWLTALRRWPEPTTFIAAPLSPETLARKLREAREAKQKYGWPFEDEVLWNTHAADAAIRAEGANVTIGPAKARFGAEVPVQMPSASDEVKFDWVTPQQLEAFCLLLHTKALVPVPNFILFNLTTEIITDLESRYDVGFVETAQEGKWSVI